MSTLSVEGIAAETGLSVRTVFRYLSALQIGAVAIVDGRQHYAAGVAQQVTQAALSARNARADAIRASIQQRKAAAAAASAEPQILSVSEVRSKAARKGGGR